ncbi:MAG: hypothetical protein AAF986_08550 [Pseudomonadota bacterium]
MSRSAYSIRAKTLLIIACLFAVASIVRTPMMVQLPSAAPSILADALLKQSDPVVRAVIAVASICHPSGDQEGNDIPHPDCPGCTISLSGVGYLTVMPALTNVQGTQMHRLSDDWRHAGLLPSIAKPRSPPAHA